jgi:subtilisin family serine protease
MPQADNGPAKKFGSHPKVNNPAEYVNPPAEPKKVEPKKAKQKKAAPEAENEGDEETEVYGLPRDTTVQGAAQNRPEYWHLPTSTWADIHLTATGRGVVIANLDTGYNPKHPLSPKPIAERSFIRSERDVVDYNGHGSHTVGTCCGRSPAISPAPEADLIVAKVLGARGYGESNAIAAAIRWATDEGADIINMSLGGPQPYGPTQEAIHYANAKGVLVVAAAGNDGFTGSRNTIGYPAKYESALCIGAYQRNGNIASFSSGGREIDIATPGQDIVSCDYRSNNLVRMSGTSMACPFAAGLFALVFELIQREGAAWPTGPGWWREFIQAHTEDRGAPGKDNQFGYGVPRYTGIVSKLAHNEITWI